ncbi:MAG TPA: SGNH/GDSL hydrolase family protein, partial [Thermoanaerobaculia bacterium]
MHRLKIVAGLLLALLLPAGAAFAQPDTGDADFTRYVALGDSLTAGFSSGSINQEFQVNSYPALIYRQATGRTTGFEQPLVSAPGIPGALRLVSLRPLILAPTPGQGQPLNLNLNRPYNNMAVPGAKLGDLLRKTQSSSASDPTDLILRRLGFTQLQQGLSLQPTLVTLWIGNNDVLAAATSGRVIEGVTITPVAQFEADFRSVAGAIAQTGAEMAIANIPNVTSIPFVTTIPRFVVNPQTNQPVLVNGQPVPLIGPNGPLQAGDFVLLTASAELAQGNGLPPGIPGASGRPLSDAAVLSAAEVATIQARVQAYNNIIRTVATERNAAFVDTNAVLSDLATRGLRIGGITFTSAFLTGGVFSYDGVHPTPFGYAYIANLFIEAINDKFDAEIPLVNLFPFIFGTATSSLSAGLEGGKAAS